MDMRDAIAIQATPCPECRNSWIRGNYLPRHKLLSYQCINGHLWTIEAKPAEAQP